MAGDNLVMLVDQDRIGEAVLMYACGNLFDLAFRMTPRVAFVRVDRAQTSLCDDQVTNDWWFWMNCETHVSFPLRKRVLTNVFIKGIAE